jgi:hypothetical protein
VRKRRLSLGVVALITACSPAPPSGQVLAQVGDVVITRRDVGVELAAAGLGATTDAATRQAVLGRLVERALLVQQAQRQRIDRTPDYLAAQRRSRDLILLDLLSEQAAGREPSRREIDAFVAARPWMFAGRQIVTADAVMPAAGRITSAELAAQPSPDVLARLLTRRGVPFVRRTVQLDSGLLLPDAAKRLVQPDRRSLVLQWEGGDALVQPIARTSAALTGQRAVEVARAVMQRRTKTRRLNAMLEQERARTPVRYQQGFGPGR